MKTPSNSDDALSAKADAEESDAKAQFAAEAEATKSAEPTEKTNFSREEVQQILDNVGPKVMVVFDYIRQDATRGSDRVILNRIRDIRTVQDLNAIEQQILEQSNGTLVRVLITNWKPLEG